MRVLRTDNGGEFTAAEFVSYCVNEGIQHHYTATYSPQQNNIQSEQRTCIAN
jgi:transposase InsO family protein